MVRLIKTFCGVGPDASWGMFSSKTASPGRRRKPKNKPLERTVKIK